MVEFRQQALTPPSGEFPSSDLPTIFADGILNLANTAQITKFYLFRFDPGLKDPDKAQQRTCAQIVMSIDALVASFAFLESAIDRLQTQGVVSTQALDAARKVVRGT
jgi:hypothetical protein